MIIALSLRLLDTQHRLLASAWLVSLKSLCVETAYFHRILWHSLMANHQTVLRLLKEVGMISTILHIWAGSDKDIQIIISSILSALINMYVRVNQLSADYQCWKWQPKINNI